MLPNDLVPEFSEKDVDEKKYIVYWKPSNPPTNNNKQTNPQNTTTTTTTTTTNKQNKQNDSPFDVFVQTAQDEDTKYQRESLSVCFYN